ncbi:hypothetical protein BXZ70DRAFT_85191 [Cristinia sonorae]|uniref:BTB domain-containing protein n=1 Tax=Cristinia sonorae TaxID=1940300 RepID=A0A8K0URN6_9AGAR|nr:hypothetical protein BXZ70DRAFT_85191 [Cristinia sonorae]
MTPTTSQYHLNPYTGPLPVNSVWNDKNELLQTAFRMSLKSGGFIDTKFYAFSRRKPAGIIGTPLPIFANSFMLRAANPYFEGLFDGGYREGGLVNIDDGYPQHRSSFTTSEEYVYEDDSDLEDDDEETAPLVENKVEWKLADTDVTGEAMHVPSGAPTRLGRVVYVPDVAHKTWMALVNYLCTGEIAFACLKSSQDINGTKDPNDTLLRCSPKSMYRVADRLGLDKLKLLCAEEIRLQLSTRNILPELFSQFTSRYSQISTFELRYFIDHGNEATIREALPPWIDALVSGRFSHCAGMLKILLPDLLSLSCSPSAATVKIADGRQKKSKTGSSLAALPPPASVLDTSHQ